MVRKEGRLLELHIKYYRKVEEADQRVRKEGRLLELHIKDYRKVEEAKYRYGRLLELYIKYRLLCLID